jgi:hypothetical protein
MIKMEVLFLAHLMLEMELCFRNLWNIDLISVVDDDARRVDN